MGWGGKRPDSGPKPKGDVKRVQLSARVDERTMAKPKELQGASSMGERLVD